MTQYTYEEIFLDKECIQGIVDSFYSKLLNEQQSAARLAIQAVSSYVS